MLDTIALIVIDVQKGFDDPGFGRRNNPDCERNVAVLIDAWRSAGRPLVFVRHDSAKKGSPLAPGTAGNAFMDVVSGNADLLVAKSVHSAFYGKPDLDAWLQERGIEKLTICGIQTNVCCETTARMASDLGYEVQFVADATFTFATHGPDGDVVSADELTRATCASLEGEFATVVSTASLVS
ncbi:isochorismatase family protein YecD [bacterium BMS3Abin02]|nr:isochorismatase family protein YecD [bacterium BMS3Abin02]GBE20777.1 isochorismatase family protein YecD [bacterium BMS3Bbin01]HDH26553.1 cysteine hydrolase [Actinomycetota bacterium]HDK45235.1 cysteine hydrolase [Actinomycetota bacterium]HDL49142.1 cysteine hydrolase [Actinomycetota bacterium]